MKFNLNEGNSLVVEVGDMLASNYTSNKYLVVERFDDGLYYFLNLQNNQLTLPYRSVSKLIESLHVDDADFKLYKASELILLSK